MLAPGRSQRRVRAPGLQGRGFFIPGGELRFMATPLGRGRIAASRTVVRRFQWSDGPRFMGRGKTTE
jgi:hypothetical protein